MGTDKAALPALDSIESLAERTARILAGATWPVLEVGPGHSRLPAVTEDHPGSGPLHAVAAGSRALGVRGWLGPAVVVATDLPLLTAGLVAWLADHPSSRSVVPLLDGRPQSLCARYATGDLDLAGQLVAQGYRSMLDLLARIDPLLAGPDMWKPAAGDAGALTDVDTPADLARMRAPR